jgi:hypothetical protein
MTPQLRRVGQSQSPVVVVDAFSGMASAASLMAVALAPFPQPARSLYPGLRRIITEADVEAFGYVEKLCNAAAPFVAGAFDSDGFDLIEASFSMVTVPPDRLVPLQRMPHFDSTDPNYVALLHYLHVPAGTGTAFFRHRATNIEQVTPGNVAAFVQAAQRDGQNLPQSSAYVQGSNSFFEELDRVQGVEDRLIIYRGALLHSGIIPDDMAFSDDPQMGRLTTNIFVQLH